MLNDTEFVRDLPGELRARFDMIVQSVPKFWAQAPYRHFTNHGPAYSERVLNQKLAQLAQQLPQERRLTQEEVFVVSSAAWLYEIGMQSPRLRPILPFENEPGTVLPLAQLQQIRAKKHLLSEKLIIDSVNVDPGGPVMQLGLTAPADEYTQLIALVCRSCSNEPLDQVIESMPVRGMPVRVRLLVALLRLADQMYLDSSRINWDLLQSPNLPTDLSTEQLARWWMHSYAQTLPIANNQIPFHYFLPGSQGEYLGHIRAFVEGSFEPNKNSEIRFLFDHGVPLIPGRTPTVQFDQSQSFLRSIPASVQAFLRDTVTPIAQDISQPVSLSLQPSVETLLVVDYESLLLQLGSQGRYPKPNEVDSLLFSLASKFKKQANGRNRPLVFAHWERDDLLETGKRLRTALFERCSIGANDDASTVIANAIIDRLPQNGKACQLILAAPRDEFADSVSRIQADMKCRLTVWLMHTPEASVYELIADEYGYLDDMLDSITANDTGALTSAAGEAICMSCLIHSSVASAPGVSLGRIRALLEDEEVVRSYSDWWLLKLLDTGILVPVAGGQAGAYELNRQHPAVQRHEQLGLAVVAALLRMGKEGSAQSRLAEELRVSGLGTTDAELSALLAALKSKEVVYIRENLIASADPTWTINPRSREVIEQDPERLLVQFVLAFDHATVRSGHANILESKVSVDLGGTFDRSVLEIVCDLALRGGWISRREQSEQRRDGRSNSAQLVLVASHPEIARALRDRDILLNILYYKDARKGLRKEELWGRLSKISAFSLSAADYADWLELLQRDKIVRRAVRDDRATEMVYTLNTDEILTQRLLGRLHLYALLRNLRIMQATGPDRAKPAADLVDRLAKFETNNDRSKAQWTMDYAVVMRLVQVQGNAVFVNVQHSFVRNLDARERTVCNALWQLVKSMPADREGWVRLPALMRKMDQDLQYGATRGEQEYWLDQAVFRLRLLEKTRTADRDEIIRPARRADN